MGASLAGSTPHNDDFNYNFENKSKCTSLGILFGTIMFSIK